MLENRFGRWVPAPLLRRLMRVEVEIERSVERFAANLPPGARVLDAGCGEGRYQDHFAAARYVGVDLGIGDATWNYGNVHCLADLEALPFADNRFDAALNVVVLEHTRRPEQVISELARSLRSGGRLLLVAPQQWEVHQAPHDYFRFTRYGLAELLTRAGLEVEEISPLGGYFTLLARRLIGALNFFQGGWRWVLFPLVALLAAPVALLLPSLDSLDSSKDFTVAYRCVAHKP